jgi:hypothetical protein
MSCERPIPTSGGRGLLTAGHRARRSLGLQEAEPGACAGLNQGNLAVGLSQPTAAFSRRCAWLRASASYSGASTSDTHTSSTSGELGIPSGLLPRQ